MRSLSVITALLSMIMLSSCTTTAYQELPSENYSFREKSLVMHFTAVDWAQSVKYLVDKGYVSSHYLVPESGDPSYPYNELKVFKLVNENERAWHAGLSYWQGRTNLNDTSIGIEIVNVPKCEHRQDSILKPQHGDEKLCVFPDFDPQQIALVIELSKEILARNPDIAPTSVVGHADIAPSRKNDPGPRFPWYQLYQAGIGAWYEQERLAYYWQLFAKEAPSVSLVQQALRSYGYGIEISGILDQQSIDVISAFQMHFLPWQVNGRVDESTAAAIFALLEKYFPDALNKHLQDYQSEIIRPRLALVERQGQVDAWFDHSHSASRFFSYENSGKFRVLASEPTRADIYVNEQKLQINDTLSDNFNEYSLSKRTHRGLNSLRVDNITQEGAQLLIQVAFPELRAKTASNIIAQSLVDELKAHTQTQQNSIELMLLKAGETITHARFDNGQMMDQMTNTDVTIYALNENTKVFATALAVMHLASQEKIDISAPLNFYFPAFQGQGRGEITILQLLAHATPYAKSINDYLLVQDAGENSLPHDKSTIREWLFSQLSALNETGATSGYSDINYVLLGLLIEQVSGLSLDDYVESMIYAPIGASQAEFKDDVILGHTGLHASAQDLAHICQMMLNKGGYGYFELASRPTVNRFLLPYQPHSDQALGWRVNTSRQSQQSFGAYASDSAFGHFAKNNAMIVDPELQSCIIVLSDDENLMNHLNISQLTDQIYRSSFMTTK